MDRKNEIFHNIMRLRHLQIIDLPREMVSIWVETIDSKIPRDRTIKDIHEFCDKFVTGELQWVKSKGVSNIITPPLRDLTEYEIQQRRIKLGLD